MSATEPLITISLDSSTASMYTGRTDSVLDIKVANVIRPFTSMEPTLRKPRLVESGV